MEKEIEIIKSLINDLKREEKLIGYDAEVEIQALENLIEGYRKLEYKYNLALTNLVTEAKRVNEEQNELNIKFISKSKIKEKIDELKQKIKNNNNKLEEQFDVFHSDFNGLDDYFKWKNTLIKENKQNEKIMQILQELMEDK